MRDLPIIMSATNALVDYKNLSPRTKAKTSRRKMARRTRINRRKTGITRVKERVLTFNKAKNSQVECRLLHMQWPSSSKRLP